MRVAGLRLTLLGAATVLMVVGCSRVPGRPGPGPEGVRPNEELDFPTCCKGNGAACHGENGRDGAVISLANPAYLAVVGGENLRGIVGRGVPRKLMPPFAKSAGGMLTDQQIGVLADGMMKQWSKPDLFTGV